LSTEGELFRAKKEGCCSGSNLKSGGALEVVAISLLLHHEEHEERPKEEVLLLLLSLEGHQNSMTRLRALRKRSQGAVKLGTCGCAPSAAAAPSAGVCQMMGPWSCSLLPLVPSSLLLLLLLLPKFSSAPLQARRLLRLPW
jgi:hypothetical protein